MQAAERIRTKDGNAIGINIYTSEVGTKGIILISPAVDVSQAHYKGSAFFFQQAGYEVVTFDFRGVGDSAPGRLKGYHANLTQWAMHDLDTVLRFIKHRFPGREIIFIGHGLGAEIVGLAPGSQFISRIILINAALSSVRHRKWNNKLWIGVLHVFIKITSWLFRYFPGKKLGLLNDLPRGVVDEWIGWCRNPNGLFDDFSDHNYRKLQVPLLSISFADDWRSRKKGVKALLEHFTAASVNWFHIKPVHIGLKKAGHASFLNSEAQDQVWSLLLQWINGEKLSSLSQIHTA